MDIFNFFASLLGYLLWGLYVVFRNYGVAIILFTIILKVLMFPMSLKQQKSMAGQARLGEKQKELKAMYGNNNAKYNEELQKLYAKEGVNPGSGCLVSLIPLPIMFAIYYSVIYPLQNTLHVAKEHIADATAYLVSLGDSIQLTQYVELDIVKNWDALRESLSQFFSPDDVEKIDFFCEGFRFLGLDLLKAPIDGAFWELLWIIPVLSLASSWFMQFYMSKSSATKQAGCMKVVMYILPLISVYFAFIFPAAVGLYWVISSLTSGVQSVVTSKFFSATHIATQKEAEQFVYMQQNEKNYEALPLHQQNEIASRIEIRDIRLNYQKNQSNKNSDDTTNNNAQPTKNKNSKNKNNNNYLGNKK